MSSKISATIIARSVAAALACILLLTGGALAGATKAQVKDTLTLRTGPGMRYDQAGTLPVGAALDVQRCMALWCLVTHKSQQGWAARDHLSFGKYPRGFMSGPKMAHVLRGSGKVCFFTGTKFTGASICSTTGTVMPDLALYGYDNAFQSVKIEGEVSVHACRDFYFGSWCETIAADQPVLNRYLRRGLSSYRVW